MTTFLTKSNNIFFSKERIFSAVIVQQFSETPKNIVISSILFSGSLSLHLVQFYGHPYESL